MRIEEGTSALEAFWAIQHHAGRAPLVDRAGEVRGWVVDHVLRCAVAAGIDLGAVPVDRFVVVDEPVDEGPPAVAVVMAGGRGERLQPLTFKVPKPLLQVGRTSILERLMEGLFAAGISEVHLAVNYMADAIEERLGDGSGFGLRVHYLREDQPLGRAGALAMIPAPAGPILLTNSDQITALGFARMVEFHRAERAAITVGAFHHEVSLPYGVLRVDDGVLAGWDEKPTMRYLCSAGFYVIEPSVLPLIPPGEPFEMPQLIDAARQEGHPVKVFPILEKWIDVGTPELLQEALLLFATGEEV